MRVKCIIFKSQREIDKFNKFDNNECKEWFLLYIKIQNYNKEVQILKKLKKWWN